MTILSDPTAFDLTSRVLLGVGSASLALAGWAAFRLRFPAKPKATPPPEPLEPVQGSPSSAASALARHGAQVRAMSMEQRSQSVTNSLRKALDGLTPEQRAEARNRGFEWRGQR